MSESRDMQKTEKGHSKIWSAKVVSDSPKFGAKSLPMGKHAVTKVFHAN